MRAWGTPPAVLAAMALKGRSASGAAPENGPRGIGRPAVGDMIESCATARIRYQKWIGRILSNPPHKDIAENVRAHQAVAR